MRRTQLYLDDQLWTMLHARARSSQTTISELVREAVRERYFGKKDERMKAMEAFVGLRQSAPASPSSTEIVRGLRQGSRMDRLTDK